MERSMLCGLQALLGYENNKKVEHIGSSIEWSYGMEHYLKSNDGIKN